MTVNVRSVSVLTARLEHVASGQVRASITVAGLLTAFHVKAPRRVVPAVPLEFSGSRLEIVGQAWVSAWRWLEQVPNSVDSGPDRVTRVSRRVHY